MPPISVINIICVVKNIGRVQGLRPRQSILLQSVVLPSFKAGRVLAYGTVWAYSHFPEKFWAQTTFKWLLIGLAARVCWSCFETPGVNLNSIKFPRSSVRGRNSKFIGKNPKWQKGFCQAHGWQKALHTGQTYLEDGLVPQQLHILGV